MVGSIPQKSRFGRAMNWTWGKTKTKTTQEETLKEEERRKAAERAERSSGATLMDDVQELLEDQEAQQARTLVCLWCDKLLAAALQVCEQWPRHLQLLLGDVLYVLQRLWPKAPKSDMLTVVWHLLYGRLVLPALRRPHVSGLLPQLPPSSVGRHNVGTALCLFEWICRAAAEISPRLPHAEQVQAIKALAPSSHDSLLGLHVHILHEYVYAQMAVLRRHLLAVTKRCLRMALYTQVAVVDPNRPNSMFLRRESPDKPVVARRDSPTLAPLTPALHRTYSAEQQAQDHSAKKTAMKQLGSHELGARKVALTLAELQALHAALYPAVNDSETDQRGAQKYETQKRVVSALMGPAQLQLLERFETLPRSKPEPEAADEQGVDLLKATYSVRVTYKASLASRAALSSRLRAQVPFKADELPKARGNPDQPSLKSAAKQFSKALAGSKGVEAQQLASEAEGELVAALGDALMHVPAEHAFDGAADDLVKLLRHLTLTAEARMREAASFDNGPKLLQLDMGGGFGAGRGAKTAGAQQRRKAVQDAHNWSRESQCIARLEKVREALEELLIETDALHAGGSAGAGATAKRNSVVDEMRPFHVQQPVLDDDEEGNGETGDSGLEEGAAAMLSRVEGLGPLGESSSSAQDFPQLPPLRIPGPARSRVPEAAGSTGSAAPTRVAVSSAARNDSSSSGGGASTGLGGLNCEMPSPKASAAVAGSMRSASIDSASSGSSSVGVSTGLQRSPSRGLLTPRGSTPFSTSNSTRPLHAAMLRVRYALFGALQRARAAHDKAWSERRKALLLTVQHGREASAQLIREAAFLARTLFHSKVLAFCNSVAVGCRMALPATLFAGLDAPPPRSKSSKSNTPGKAKRSKGQSSGGGGNSTWAFEADTVDDFIDEFTRFGAGLVNDPALGAKVYHSFLRLTRRALTSDAAFAAHETDAALAIIEAFVTAQLQSVMYSGEVEDAIFANHLEEASWLRPHHLDLPQTRSQDMARGAHDLWSRPIDELAQLRSHSSPRQKLSCLTRCIKWLPSVLEGKSAENGNFDADTSLSALIYTIVRAPADAAIASTVRFVELFLPPDDVYPQSHTDGEAGFCLTQFQLAISYITNLGPEPVASPRHSVFAQSAAGTRSHSSSLWQRAAERQAEAAGEQQGPMPWLTVLLGSRSWRARLLSFTATADLARVSAVCNAWRLHTRSVLLVRTLGVEYDGQVPPSVSTANNSPMNGVGGLDKADPEQDHRDLERARRKKERKPTDVRELFEQDKS